VNNISNQHHNQMSGNYDPCAEALVKGAACWSRNQNGVSEMQGNERNPDAVTPTSSARSAGFRPARPNADTGDACAEALLKGAAVWAEREHGVSKLPYQEQHTGTYAH
jgi:hypothetical protein